MSGGLVLTCAHLVQHVLRLRHEESPQGPLIKLDHPGSATDAVSYASVTADGWAPPEDDRGDVAVLRLTGPTPEDCTPARLRPYGAHRGRTVRVFGQATAAPPGVWIAARVAGATGPDRVQLDCEEPGVRPGYSGAGVVDEQGDVIGVVVSALRSRGATAWMIPVEAAVRYCPLLGDAVDHEHASTPVLAAPATVPPAPTAAPVTPSTAPSRPATAPVTPTVWPRGAGRELAAALARVPSMRDRQRRDSVLRDAGEEIFDLAERSSVLIEDVRGVVELCLQYADGIDRLVEALRWYERGSLPMQEFERVLEGLRGASGRTP